MAQAKPLQQTAHRGPVHVHSAPGQLHNQLVQGHLAVLVNPLPDPIRMTAQLAISSCVTLPLGRKQTGLALQDHHVVHKPWGNSEMGRSRPSAVTLLDKCDNTSTKFNRMWLAHSNSPSTNKENQMSADLGIPNLINHNTL